MFTFFLTGSTLLFVIQRNVVTKDPGNIAQFPQLYATETLRYALSDREGGETKHQPPVGEADAGDVKGFAPPVIGLFYF